MNSIKALGAVITSTLILTSTPALVAAKGLSYSFAEAGYEYLDEDEFDMDAARVDLSFGVHDYVALLAGYTRGWTDDFPTSEDPSGDPDLNEFRGGLRPHYSLLTKKQKLDVYADFVAWNRKFNGDRTNTDLGYTYGAGLRYLPHKRIEVRLAGEYKSGDVDETFVVFGPVIKLTKQFSLSLHTSHSSDSSDYFAGFRLDF